MHFLASFPPVTQRLEEAGRRRHLLLLLLLGVCVGGMLAASGSMGGRRLSGAKPLTQGGADDEGHLGAAGAAAAGEAGGAGNRDGLDSGLRLSNFGQLLKESAEQQVLADGSQRRRR